MTQSLDEFGALEQGMAGLLRAEAALGANTVAVLVLEATSLEIAYGRTEAGALPLAAAIPCDLDILVALNSRCGPVSADSSLALFLTSAVAPTANSFLLFPWRDRPRSVTIVFGFAAREPAYTIPADVMDSLNLAALTAWSVQEVSRLRAELRTANHSFAGRKLVERVKGILQSERGMSEQQAYEYLRRISRQRRITLSKLAEDLLSATHWP